MSLSALHDASSRLLFRLAGAALAAIVVLYLFEVSARYLFNAPTTWSGEVVRYALSVLIFFALPEITRRGSHVAIDIVPSVLPERLQSALLKAGFLLGSLVCLVAGAIAGREALRQIERGLMTNAAHPIPRWWITAVIAIGLISAALHFARNGLGRKPAA